MTLASWLEIVFFFVLLVISTPLLGSYMAKVYENGKAPGDRFFLPIERFCYRACRIDPDSEPPTPEFPPRQLRPLFIRGSVSSHDYGGHVCSALRLYDLGEHAGSYRLGGTSAFGGLLPLPARNTLRHNPIAAKPGSPESRDGTGGP